MRESPVTHERENSEIMKLAELLNELNWTQTRLAQKAHISTSTVKRALTPEKRVSRDHANIICTTLSRALGRKITYLDVDEFHEHQLPLERGPRKPRQPGQQILVDGVRPPTKHRRKRKRRHQSPTTQEQNIPE